MTTVNTWDSYGRCLRWRIKCADTGRWIPAGEGHLYDKPTGKSYCWESPTYRYWAMGASEKQALHQG